MLWLECLDYNFPFSTFSSGTSAHLNHELIGSFVRPEVREIQNIIGIKNSNYTYILKIETFGNHLCANKYVCLSFRKFIDDFFVSKFCFRRIGVESANCSFGEENFQIVFDFFSSKSFCLNIS